MDDILRSTIDKGDLDTVKLLLQGESINVYNEVLNYAVFRNQLNIVEYALQNGADVHNRGKMCYDYLFYIGDEFPLRCATDNKCFQIIYCLLQHGANIHKVNMEHLLCYIVHKNLVKDMKILLEYQVKLTGNLLEEIIKNKNKDILQLLITKLQNQMTEW